MNHKLLNVLVEELLHGLQNRADQRKGQHGLFDTAQKLLSSRHGLEQRPGCLLLPLKVLLKFADRAAVFLLLILRVERRVEDDGNEDAPQDHRQHSQPAPRNEDQQRRRVPDASARGCSSAPAAPEVGRRRPGASEQHVREVSQAAVSTRLRAGRGGLVQVRVLPRFQFGVGRQVLREERLRYYGEKVRIVPSTTLTLNSSKRCTTFKVEADFSFFFFSIIIVFFVLVVPSTHVLAILVIIQYVVRLEKGPKNETFERA